MAAVSNTKFPLIFVLAIALLSPSAVRAQTLNWSYQTGNLVYSSPAVGSDGTIYIGSTDRYLYALNSDGTLKWRYQTGDNIFSSPAIGADGTIYVGSNDNYLYALNSDGTLQWRYRTDGLVFSSPAIDSDGTIYVGSNDKNLYALNADGTLKWKFQTGGYVFSSPSIDTDGTIYIGSYDNHLYALNPDGTFKWSYQAGGEIYSSPAISSDGTIYFGSWDGHLYAVNSDGTLKWKFQTGDFVDSSPAIGSDGTIYVGSYDMHLYAINPDGTLKWKFNTGNFVGSSPAIGQTGSNSFALFNQGNDEIIFVGSGEFLLALQSNGTKKWEFQTGIPFNFWDTSTTVYSGLVIGADSNGTVYAVNTECKSLAPSDWPKWKEGLQCTSQAKAVVEVASPTLTLSGEGDWGGCPDELPGKEVTILSFSLSADEVDSWKVDSIRFESSGSGNEYEAIEEVLLYQDGNPQPLTRDNYVDDNETITLIPEKIIDIPRGQTVNLRLAYKFRDRAMQECTSGLDFRVRIRHDWIAARPVSYTSGSKVEKEIEGIIAFGCVKNTTTNKIFFEIQAAIDDSETKDGHTIIVCPGTYVENVVVTKNGLTIRSRDGKDVTIVQCRTSGDWIYSPVFQIIGNNTTIDGFTIRGSKEHGVGIVGSKGNEIINNTITENRVFGVRLYTGSKGNKIINNTIVKNRNGIDVLYCNAPKDSPNLVEGNNIEGDYLVIFLRESSGAKIINNTIAKGKYGIGLVDCKAPKDSPNLIEGNDIQGNDKYGVEVVSSSGTKVVDNTIKSNGSGVYLSRSEASKDSLNLIEGNNILGNISEGVFLRDSFGTNIINNIIASGTIGIYLHECRSTKGSPNFINRNNISGHKGSGIYSDRSYNNLIIKNEIWYNCRGIESKNSSNEIRGNDIHNSECSQTGIHLDGSSSEIIGNTIRDDAGDGIGCENGANPIVRKNNITNNTGFGLNNIDVSINIDAQENWWGDASGPAGAGSGTGDEVSENVDFSNWRTEPVAFVIAPYWDAHGARGTEVTATFYIANISDSNDAYNISVSDTLGWGLHLTTLTETVTAGESKEIQITVSIPLEAPIATENEIILAATSTSNPNVTESGTLKVSVGEILINEIDTYAGRVELYNPGPQGISLAGWTLITGDREIELIIPEYAPDWDGILEGGAYLVIHLSSIDTTNSPSEDIYEDIDEDDIEEVLSEAGNSLAILNPSGGGIDFIRYGESEDGPPEGTQWHGDESENPELPEEDQSLGRDRNSTDTNQASDWENTGGADADFPTPGWQNILVCISARSGNWKDTNTWEGEHIPRAIDDAVICEEHIVTVNSLQQCKLLFLSDNATLKVNDSLPEAADGYDFHLLSIVEYSSSISQTISTVPIYGQLIVSGSGTKIANDGLQVDDILTIKEDAEMQNNGQMTVEHDLGLEDSSTLILGGNLDVNGDLYIGENATLNGGSYTINLAGDWNNGGTYNYGTSTVVFDQSLGSQFIGPLTDDFLHFYNLTISTGGSPGTTTSLGNLHVHGDLTVSSGSELLMEEKEIIVDGLTIFPEN